MVRYIKQNGIDSSTDVSHTLLLGFALESIFLCFILNTLNWLTSICISMSPNTRKKLPQPEVILDFGLFVNKLYIIESENQEFHAIPTRQTCIVTESTYSTTGANVQVHFNN